MKGGSVSDYADQPCGTPGPVPAPAGPCAIRFRGRDTLSLRQLDQLNQVPKGTTFRRFKACRAGLVEGRDFFRLDAGEHSTLLATLREEGSIYPSSVHVVLLTESGCRRLTEGPC
ncbi:MAG: ORF6N domain-containing protein [Thioalkalivibrio sp.]|nr:ORF6N domain-containing protein [Thioalkalivibrio sp.]